MPPRASKHSAAARRCIGLARHTSLRHGAVVLRVAGCDHRGRFSWAAFMRSAEFSHASETGRPQRQTRLCNTDQVALPRWRISAMVCVMSGRRELPLSQDAVVSAGSDPVRAQGCGNREFAPFAKRVLHRSPAMVRS